MTIRSRFLLIFFVCTVMLSYLVARSVNTELRPIYLASMEDALLDAAHLLAQQAENAEALTNANMAQVFDFGMQREFSSSIYSVERTTINCRVYVCDAQGLLVYDSDNTDPQGTNYSSWNDVSLCLQGDYGARATRTHKDDPTSLILYIAAPIRKNNVIVGSLTLGKPISHAALISEQLTQHIFVAVAIALLVLLVLVVAVTVWITRPIQLLTEWTTRVKQGEQPTLPHLGVNDMAFLGEQMEAMRQEIEGKGYIEEYISSLTHELKSPLTSISSAVEILHENPDEIVRDKFINHIDASSVRLRNIVEQLLLLSKIERMNELQQRENCCLQMLVEEELEQLAPLIVQKKLHIQCDLQDCLVFGDPFLLRQALNNIFKNALEFSPVAGVVKVVLMKNVLSIYDAGPGIPDYALSRLYERFYSLSRPNGDRSTGLGLCFTKHIFDLHGFGIHITNHNTGGCKAVVTCNGK